MKKTKKKIKNRGHDGNLPQTLLGFLLGFEPTKLRKSMLKKIKVKKIEVNKVKIQ
jgi:hypothetical protein